MRHPLPYLLSAFVGVVGVACRTQSPETGVAFEGRIGVYRFSERIPVAPGAVPIMLQGQFTVLGDTIIVDTDPGPCRYDKRTTRISAIIYQCGEVTINLDRRNPVEKSSYVVAVSVPNKQQPQCSATVRRNCTTSQDAGAEHTEYRTGTIKAEPVR